MVNTTNQFNLNGRRYTEADWRKLLSSPGVVWAAVSYEDKFGALGTIAVVAGRLLSDRLAIETWVMSCRAFARRIEHQTLKLLFETTGTDVIEFSFTPTTKNGPLLEFFANLLSDEPQAEFRLTRSQFEAKCRALYQEVREMRRAEAHGWDPRAAQELFRGSFPRPAAGRDPCRIDRNACGVGFGCRHHSDERRRR